MVNKFCKIKVLKVGLLFWYDKNLIKSAEQDSTTHILEAYFKLLKHHKKESYKEKSL